MTNMRNYLSQASRRFASHIAIEDDTRRWTYAQTWERGVRMANGLRALGLRKGDRIGSLEDNAAESSDLVLGCAIAGLSRVPLYARNALESHLHMLRETGSVALCVSPEYASLFDGAAASLPALRLIFRRDDGYEAWLASQSAEEQPMELGAGDEFMVRHSGGTTGRAKGLPLTSAMWVNALRNVMSGYVKVQPGDISYHFAPITHASGTLFFLTYFCGGINFMVPSFNVDRLVARFRAGGITNMFLPPTALRSLVQHPGMAGVDPTSVKGLMIGGSTIPVELVRAARRMFGDTNMYQLYGASEGGPACMMGPQEWFAEIDGSEPLASAGRPLPWIELEIRDPVTSAPTPLGEVGEIVTRGEAQIAHFLNVDDDARVFRDGWVYAGDLGRMDANGYLYIVDRKDDMIISGGFNIWPAEIENILLDQPGVLDAAVFAVPHEHWGQTPYAVCVAAEPSMLHAGDLIRICAEKLGSYKKPSHVEIVSDPLPKTPVGKTDRRKLRMAFTSA
jgi:acyl-CoA synthetase (AMP-forming)/AMP-acid ligase II